MQDEARRGVPERWRFSPQRLRGHRERLRVSRPVLGAMSGISAYTIKAYEYGQAEPSLHNYLSLIDSLGISPTDLLRIREVDDEAEYMRGRHWHPPPPTVMRRL